MARAPKVKRRSSFTTVCYAVLAVVRENPELAGLSERNWKFPKRRELMNAAKVSGYIVAEEGLRQFQQYDKFRDALLRDLEFVAEGRRREEQLRHRLRVSERRQKRKREP